MCTHVKATIFNQEKQLLTTQLINYECNQVYKYSQGSKLRPSATQKQQALVTQCTIYYT